MPTITTSHTMEADADITALSLLVFYNCRQTVSTGVPTLTDASGNGYNATTGRT